MFISAESDGSIDVGCTDLILDTESGIYGPHPVLTESLHQQVQVFAEERSLGIGNLVYPCTATPTLANNTMVFAALDGLIPTTEPVVLRINVETGTFVAIVSDEPTNDVSTPSG